MVLFHFLQPWITLFGVLVDLIGFTLLAWQQFLSSKDAELDFSFLAQDGTMYEKVDYYKSKRWQNRLQSEFKSRQKMSWIAIIVAIGFFLQIVGQWPL